MNNANASIQIDTSSSQQQRQPAGIGLSEVLSLIQFKTTCASCSSETDVCCPARSQR